MEFLSGTDIFEIKCDERIPGLDSLSTIKANKLITLSAQISKRYPLVHLPDFMNDFMHGMYTKKLMKKYNLHIGSDYSYLLNYILKIPQQRSKDQNKNNLEINLKNPKFEQLYTLITSQIDIFDDLFDNMLNYNILQSLFVYAILDCNYMDSRDVHKKILDVYNEIKQEILILSDYVKLTSFENYLQNDLIDKLDDISGYLGQKSYITYMDGNVSLPIKYSNMDKTIYENLREKNEGTTYGSLQSRFFNKFPLLKMTFHQKLFDDLLGDLEQKQKLVRIPAFWKYAPNSDQLFTYDNYEIKMQRIKDQRISAGRTKFFGRNINPDEFISELKILETGDLDDLDDQVTRIAGLVLSDAVLLQSPRENMDEFDFIIDITNYNFRPEQEDAMKSIDFQVTSNTFHCKIMINETVTKDILSKFKDAMPKGEQGIVFTCMPVSQDVLQHTKNDRTVQIIDEEGLRKWSSITPTIPCRRHSVSQVMFGDGKDKIVLVKSMNYESGLAVVETVPDRIETTFQIGCLREIDLCVTDLDDFETASDAYFDFLCMLASMAPHTFDSGISMNVINVHSKYLDLLRDTNPELFSGPHPEISHVHDESKHDRYVQFEYIYTKINLAKHTNTNSSFQCECSHKLNEEQNRTLCDHLVASINELCVGNTHNWYEISKNINLFKTKLEKFQEENMRRMIDAIYYVLANDGRSLFKEYLLRHTESN